MTTISAYQIKWILVINFGKNNSPFNRNYKNALRNAGFSQIGKGDIFGLHYNSKNVTSCERAQKAVEKLKTRIATYKHPKATFAATITDKQFGLIGKCSKLKMRKIPTSIGDVPVTTQQFLYSGNWKNHDFKVI